MRRFEDEGSEKWCFSVESVEKPCRGLLLRYRATLEEEREAAGRDGDSVRNLEDSLPPRLFILSGSSCVLRLQTGRNGDGVVETDVGENGDAFNWESRRRRISKHFKSPAKSRLTESKLLSQTGTCEDDLSVCRRFRERIMNYEFHQRTVPLRENRQSPSERVGRVSKTHKHRDSTSHPEYR